MTKKLAGVILCTFMVIVILAVHVIKHEEVHKAIFEDYGCNNVTIEYSINGGLTSCNDPQNYDIEGNQYHVINEIISYNLLTVIVLVYSFTLVWIAIKED